MYTNFSAFLRKAPFEVFISKMSIVMAYFVREGKLLPVRAQKVKSKSTLV